MSEVYAVKLRDNATLEELKTFVRYPNGTWKAMQGLNTHDDRVMSLIWALMILENEITEQYFEIELTDKNNKPAVIKNLDYGLRQFSNTLSLYNDEKLGGGSTLPIFMDSEYLPGDGPGTGDSGVDELQQQGWTFL